MAKCRSTIPTWRTPTPTLLRLVLILAMLLHSWVPPTDMSNTFERWQNMCRVGFQLYSSFHHYLHLLGTKVNHYLCSIQAAAPIETSHSIDMVVQHCYSKSASKSIYYAFDIFPHSVSSKSPPSPSLHACDAAPTICSWVVDVHCSYLNDFC